MSDLDLKEAALVGAPTPPGRKALGHARHLIIDDSLLLGPSDKGISNRTDLYKENVKLKSPLAYIGGKSRLAKQIISKIHEHRTYVEAFSGAAWVSFSKEESKIEVINDLDSDLITFYRCVQNHLEEFLRQFRWLLTSRQVFEDWKEQISQQGLTDIQRAARYYYLQRLCFGGRVNNRSFGISTDRRPKLNLLRIEQEMSDVHLRLCGVHIENLPAEELIKRYDHKDSFFYCDPPYYKKPFYKHNMKKADYIRHADRLAGIEGKFLYSINDHPVIREIFKGFKIEPVTLLYTVGTNKAKKGKELLISNY